VSTEAPEPIVIDVTAGLAAAGKEGERRSIHRRPYRRVKPMPKRPSMLDRHRVQIDAWLEVTPALTAVDVLARLPNAMQSGQTGGM
jgi:hypothetical protein